MNIITCGFNVYFMILQRGELALTLLTHYKDDQDRLARIMDKLLDKEVHQMYKAPSLPTYYINNAPSQVNCSVCLLLPRNHSNMSFCKSFCAVSNWGCEEACVLFVSVSV